MLRRTDPEPGEPPETLSTDGRTYLEDDLEGNGALAPDILGQVHLPELAGAQGPPGVEVFLGPTLQMLLLLRLLLNIIEPNAVETFQNRNWNDK